LDHRQPIFNAPGVVVCLLTTFFAVHLLLWGLLPASENEQLVLALAFIPARIAGGAGDLPGGHVAVLTSFVTHQFVHGNLPHLLVNAAWFLAFGTPIARRTDVWRFLAFFVTCGVAGALVYLAINGDARVLMVGASGSISGLMGATFRFVFRGMRETAAPGMNRAMSTGMNPDATPGTNPGTTPGTNRSTHSGMILGLSAPLMSLSETLRDRRILAVIVGWTVLNVLLAEGASGLTEAAGIAWEAHLGGFYAGILLYGFFDRPQRFAGDSASAE
jgi:membrane associated rhomboid family serine protease